MERYLRAQRVTVALGAGLVLCLAAAASASPGRGRCGDAEINKGEQCDQNNLNGQTCESLGNDAGALSCGANCQFDTSQCIPAECGNGVQGPTEDCEVGSPAASCEDLNAGFGTAQCGPACTFDTSTCSASRFVDNADGTVTDFQTELVWEKKIDGSSSGTSAQEVGDCLHCAGDVYTWTTAMSKWISAVNGGRTVDPSSQTGFAGHTDWRVPTIVELQTISDCSFSPCLDPIFGPTLSTDYWSSSTDPSLPGLIWTAAHGGAFHSTETAFEAVRAVRTGP